MLATFSLRLACGLACSLLVLTPAHVHPRFYRTQFLTVLGLLALVAVASRASATLGLTLALVAALLCSFVAALAWSVSRTPPGQWLSSLAAAATLSALILARLAEPPQVFPDPSTAPAPGWSLADDVTSGLVLGAAVTAMLMGHSYLIAPAMSLTPLFRLLALLLLATVLRMTLATAGLWSWTAEHSLGNLEDETVLWLPLRWGVGFVGPLVLAWMAWQAAKIRSTQSATGILYAVVVLSFVGELTSQLLVRSTGFVL